MSQSWNIGTLHKPAIWYFYVISNYCGVILCVLVVMLIICNVKRSASDIIVCGLLFACTCMSLNCGTQCVLNIHFDRFYGGTLACEIEAIAHVSSILTEFWCVMFLSVNMYCIVICKNEVSNKMAFLIVCGIVVISLAVTCLLGLVSPIYLVSAGTYCMYAFKSYAIAAWLVPSLLIAITVMIFCHVSVVKHLTKLLAYPTVDTHLNVTTLHDIWKAQLKWRSTLFIFAVIACWGLTSVTCIYEFAVGRATEELVTAVGVMGISFSWIAPLIFLFTSAYRKSLQCPA